MSASSIAIRQVWFQVQVTSNLIVLFNVLALEWSGIKEPARNVEIQLDVRQCALVVLSPGKVYLRSVDLSHQKSIMVWMSSDKYRNHFLLPVPKEYDLVSI